MPDEAKPYPERLAVLESQFLDMRGDIQDIKTSVSELVRQGEQAKGRSEANARILQGLPPAMWMTFMGAIGAAVLWVWEHLPFTKTGS